MISGIYRNSHSLGSFRQCRIYIINRITLNPPKKNIPPEEQGRKARHPLLKEYEKYTPESRSPCQTLLEKHKHPYKPYTTDITPYDKP